MSDRLPLLSRAHRDERGAVTTIVVVLLSLGVLTGMLALTVDVGNIYYERRQLQNGADAASRSLANVCLRSPGLCDPALTAGTDTTAGTARLKILANANAGDTKAALDTSVPMTSNGQCGHNAGTLPQCESFTKPPTPAQVDRCGPPPGIFAAYPTAKTIGYAEVYTRTQSPTGSSLLRPWFASGDGRTFRACARAAWGPAKVPAANILPVTISECDYRRAVGLPTKPDNGTSYTWPPPSPPSFPARPTGSWPGYGGAGQAPWPGYGVEKAIYTKGGTEGAAGGCPTSSAGWTTAPGGFSALENFTGSCQAKITGLGWQPGNTGNDKFCPATDLANLRGKIVYIPIYTCAANIPSVGPPPPGFDCSGGGNGLKYYLAGYAAFYLSGYYLSSTLVPSINPNTFPKNPCNGSDRCISGWFVEDVVSSGTLGDPGQMDYGLKTIVGAG